MWYLSIMQATLGTIKAFWRSKGLSGSVQDIKSDKPSGLHYQTSREGKLKQGVSLNCHYPCSGNSIRQGKVVAERKKLGHVGTNPPSPRNSAPIQDLEPTDSCITPAPAFVILRRGWLLPGCSGWKSKGADASPCPGKGVGAVGGTRQCSGSVQHWAAPGMEGRKGGWGEEGL